MGIAFAFAHPRAFMETVWAGVGSSGTILAMFRCGYGWCCMEYSQTFRQADRQGSKQAIRRADLGFSRGRVRRCGRQREIRKQQQEPARQDDAGWRMRVTHLGACVWLCRQRQDVFCIPGLLMCCACMRTIVCMRIGEGIGRSRRKADCRCCCAAHDCREGVVMCVPCRCWLFCA